MRASSPPSWRRSAASRNPDLGAKALITASRNSSKSNICSLAVSTAERVRDARMLKMSRDLFKAIAAERAVELVQPGMKLGLGTGSTSAKFVELLGKKVAAGGLD